MPECVVKTKAGKTVVLQELKAAQVMDLVAWAADSARARLVADMDAAGIEPNAKLDRLREHDDVREVGRDLVKACLRLSGSHRVISAALQNGTAFDDLDFSAPGSMWQTALDLLDVPWRDAPTDPTKTGQSPGETGGSKSP